MGTGVKTSQGKRSVDSEMQDKFEAEQIEEMAREFTTEELQEFLEADLLDVQADPEFKERLRRKLWELVQAGLGKTSRSD
jgi:hypothetical protein